MKHDIIKTDNYLLVVDESEITKGNWHLANDVMITKSHLIDENCKKIIAHLPLNGSPILEGVDLLPPLGDEVEKMAFEKFSNKNPTTFATRAIWIDGYNKAKEKYKYTEEDLRKAMFLYSAWITGGTPSLRIAETAEERQEQIIQSLSQPKMPIGFEFEASKSRPVFNGEPKTLSNVVGFTRWTWVGTYIFN